MITSAGKYARKVILHAPVCLCFFIVTLSYAIVSIDTTVFWKAVAQYGGNASAKRQAELTTLFHEALSQSEREKLEWVNQYVQRETSYLSDEEVWQQSDYWASPAEFLAKEQGDCEDFAIVKYLFLVYLGIPEEKLRLIYVKAKIGGRRSTLSQAHMVLGYYETSSSQPYILDSLIDEVLPAQERTDLTPVFSFNSFGIWSPGQKNSVGSPSARLSRWRNILEKIKREGITLTQT